MCSIKQIQKNTLVHKVLVPPFLWQLSITSTIILSFYFFYKIIEKGNICFLTHTNLPSLYDKILIFFRSTGVWSPNKSSEVQTFQNETVEKTVDFKTKDKVKDKDRAKDEGGKDEPMPVVWTPSSANASPVAERKEFRPVSFESPVLGRKNKSKVRFFKFLSSIDDISF